MTRSDKGLVAVTKRDLYCIEWIAHQYVVRLDQIRVLLSRFPTEGKPFKDGEMISESAARDQISRWVRGGWIEYKRVLAGHPGWATVTKKGLALVGLEEVYTAKEPSPMRFPHFYAINHVRLLYVDDRPIYSWESERSIRAALGKWKKGKNVGPIPDAVVRFRVEGAEEDSLVAVEVELSEKKPDELEEKVRRLLWEVEPAPEDDEGNCWKYDYLWFFVRNEGMKSSVERALEKLKPDLEEEDEGRSSVLSIVVDRFLLGH